MGGHRSVPIKTKHSVLGQSKRLSFCCTQMRGWRQHMQDAHIIKPDFTNDCSLFAVFDGHGGGETARFVSKHFAEQLLKNKNFEKRQFQEALTQTFFKIDEMMLTQEGQEQLVYIKRQWQDEEQLHEDQKHKKKRQQEEKQRQKRKKKLQQTQDYCQRPNFINLESGCTANVLLITEKDIYCANAGDSRTVRSINSNPDALSKDHKPQSYKQIKRIQKAGGEIYSGRVNGNLNLTRGFGDFQFKQNKELKPQQQIITAKPDIKKRPLADTDFIVMGCDGIWESKTNKQMVDWIHERLKVKSMKQINEQLFEQLIAKQSGERQGSDNMTAIIIKLTK